MKKILFLIFFSFYNKILNKINEENKMKKDIVLITDPRVLKINIEECYEEMIDLIEIKEEDKKILYGSSPEIADNKDYTKMRKSIYLKLLEVNRKLKPLGYEICLYECWRSISLQKMLFDNIYNRFKKDNPNWTHEEIFKKSTEGVSPVINLDGTINVPAHSTGGAIDVYLVDINTKEFIDMGPHPKEPYDDKLSPTNSNEISEEAKKNRKLMTDVLREVGFVNYPTEYWHWSYGDRYWAYISKKEKAIYGSIFEYKK